MVVGWDASLQQTQQPSHDGEERSGDEETEPRPGQHGDDEEEQEARLSDNFDYNLDHFIFLLVGRIPHHSDVIRPILENVRYV